MICNIEANYQSTRKVANMGNHAQQADGNAHAKLPAMGDGFRWISTELMACHGYSVGKCRPSITTMTLRCGIPVKLCDVFRGEGMMVGSVDFTASQLVPLPLHRKTRPEGAPKNRTSEHHTFFAEVWTCHLSCPGPGPWLGSILEGPG